MSSRHRGWAVVGAVVAIIGACAAIALFIWLPRYRPALSSGESLGIDVSHHQGSIDWQRVADDGVTFVYMKATEGSNFVDDRFDENWSGAGAVGLRRGAYHFFSLCSRGEDQAANFLDVVPGDTELPPAVDLEFGACEERPPDTAVRRELTRFLETVESSFGRPAILYVGDDFEARYPSVSAFDRGRWRLGFVFRPAEPWLVWQVGSSARVDGIDGPVGLDVLRWSG